jgi:hypothetical protein
MMKESTISCLRRIRQEYSLLGIILTVPPTIKKEEVMQIIKDRLIESMLMQPFSTEVPWNYINKICLVNHSFPK